MDKGYSMYDQARAKRLENAKKDGWSNRIDSSIPAKLHYFPHEKNGRSICGMVVLSDRRHKSIFVDIETYNKKKICKLCQKFKGESDNLIRLTQPEKSNTRCR